MRDDAQELKTTRGRQLQSRLKILVTGATGTIGTELTSALVSRGETVYALERYVTGRFRLDPNGKTRIVYGDVRDFNTVRHVLDEVQPDVVVHLAATSAVAYSYDHPHEVMETNLGGTINLAEACLHGVKHLKQFLFASTSETYGNGPIPKREDTQQNPNSPYSVSKMAAEKYLLYLHAAYKFPVTILRPFNTYGRKANQHFVVERTIVQMLAGEAVRLGEPEPVRDFLYIEDHVNAYLTCLENQKTIGETINFCTGRGITIRDLANKLANLTGFKGEIRWYQTPTRPLDIRELVGSYEKAQRLLGWKPAVNLEEGLSRTVELWRKITSH